MSKQTDTQVFPELDSQSNSPVQKLRSLVRQNLVGTITATVAGSLLLTGVSAVNIWSIYNSFQSTVAKQFKLQKLSSDQVYQDEYFTMTTKMLVSTGDRQWEERYKKMLPIAEATTKEFLANITPELRAEAKKTDDAANILFAAEDKVLKLVSEGKKDAAAQLLEGEEYTTNKKIFGDGNRLVLDKVDKLIQKELSDYQQQLVLSIVVAGATLPVLLAAWMFVIAAVRDYIRDRIEAQKAIEESQTNLLAANKSLEIESKNRREQEQIIREERDTLQQDIGDLLDVVCEIEAGDFTVNAEVNPRATGLMGDVLNRLVEQLGRTFAEVAASAQRVAMNSSIQDKIATIVAENTSEQTNSVDRVLALTQTVRSSANEAATQLADTDLALSSLQTAVTSGEATVSSLDGSIDVLQQGSDRIIQQMKTLGEFVGLADRFVYDQTDIATQTQILALNASLVAARAAEQRDPKQFEAVAREFESIAEQVSQLAQQTNEGLTTLEQSNAQIHKVVSDVDGEVQQLGNLVNNFTQGVKQTREVFGTVKSVTGQVVKAGEVVSQTSKTIIESADSTAKSISEIATLSSQIATQSQTARTISSQMNELSAELLNRLQVFKLPAKDLEIAAANSEIIDLQATADLSTANLDSNPSHPEHIYQFN